VQTDHTEKAGQRDVGGMVTAAIFILVAVVALWDMTNMVDADSYVFPRAVAIAMIIFCILLIAWGLIRPGSSHGEASVPGASTLRRVSLVIAMFASTALMPWLGFLVSGFAAFVSIMFVAMYDEWTPFRKLVYPLVCAAFVLGFYVLFAELLSVPLPVGSLFE
jgi:putative tricarboxylic transport membrane protein